MQRTYTDSPASRPSRTVSRMVLSGFRFGFPPEQVQHSNQKAPSRTRSDEPPNLPIHRHHWRSAQTSLGILTTGTLKKEQTQTFGGPTPKLTLPCQRNPNGSEDKPPVEVWASGLGSQIHALPPSNTRSSGCLSHFTWLQKGAGVQVPKTPIQNHQLRLT